ncbi:hypothetical protein [Haladaptatus litoreus]|nr:hypothetical protein [Haladaptatus litoreus]
MPTPSHACESGTAFAAQEIFDFPLAPTQSIVRGSATSDRVNEGVA